MARDDTITRHFVYAGRHDERRAPRGFAWFAVARPLLLAAGMSNPQELSVEVLGDVRGGRGFVEGVRKLYNAGVVAWQVLNPSHKPPPRIPEPPRIERPAPTLPGPRRSPGGPDPAP